MSEKFPQARFSCYEELLLEMLRITFNALCNLESDVGRCVHTLSALIVFLPPEIQDVEVEYDTGKVKVRKKIRDIVDDILDRYYDIVALSEYPIMSENPLKDEVEFKKQLKRDIRQLLNIIFRMLWERGYLIRLKAFLHGGEWKL